MGWTKSKPRKKKKKKDTIEASENGQETTESKPAEKTSVDLNPTTEQIAAISVYSKLKKIPSKENSSTVSSSVMLTELGIRGPRVPANPTLHQRALVKTGSVTAFGSLYSLKSSAGPFSRFGEPRTHARDPRAFTPSVAPVVPSTLLGHDEVDRLTKSLYLAVERNSILRIHIAQQKRRAELQDAEITSLFSTRDDDRATVQVLQEQLQELKQDSDTQVKELAVLKARMFEVRMGEQKKVAELAFLKTTILESGSALDKVLEETNQVRAAAGAVRQEHAALEADIAASQEAASKLKAARAATLARIGELTNLHKQCPQKLETVLKTIATTDSKWEHSMSQLRMAHADLKERHGHCAQTIEEQSDENHCEKIVLHQVARRLQQLQQADKKVLLFSLLLL